MFQRKILTCLFLISFCRAVSSQSSQCDCDITKSWNDIMILIDSSSTMGSARFGQMQAFIKAALTDATIGNQPFQTQVGVVTYSKSATIMAGISDYKNTSDFLQASWGKINNSTDTNVMNGIILALSELTAGRHRKNSRQVLIIGAASYKNGNYSFPHEEASDFKKNSGVIIVVALDECDELKAIATEGMYLDGSHNQLLDAESLTTLLCNANCFCPGHQPGSDSRYFPVANEGESWPSLGCYWLSEYTAVQPVANRGCTEVDAASGVAANPDTPKKQQGLLSYAPTNTTKPSYYIGLTKSSSGRWMWGNGRLYVGDVPMGDGDCAILQQGSGFSTMINATDCLSGHLYACQTQPCTSKYYCEFN